MDWLEEDAELLDAALFLLADEPILGDTALWLQPVSSLPSDHSETGLKARRTSISGTGKAINVSRERKRQELQSLRTQAEHLKKQLAALQLRREQQLRPFIDADGHGQGVAVYWEAIAKRQFLAQEHQAIENMLLAMTISSAGYLIRHLLMEWLKEDAELLDAALYMLVSDTDHEHDDTMLKSIALPFDDGPGPAKRARKSAGPAKVINASRERQRKELLGLRSEAEELGRKLAALQLRREQQLRPFLTADGEAKSVVVYWEAIAKHQFQERKRSELLNSKLKSMQETQLRVAENLMVAIRDAEEQRRQINAEGLIFGDKKPRVRPAIDVSQKVTEENQLERLELLSTQCEEAFTRSPKLCDPSCVRFMDIEMREDHDGDGLVMDVYCNSAFPQPVALVEDVLWQFYLAESAEEDGNTWAQDFRSTTDDNLIDIFESVTTLQGVRTVFNGKYVAKRVVDDRGRLNIAFHSFCVGQQSGRPEKAEMDEDSWIRIIDAADIGCQDLSAQLTILQHVRRTKIAFTGLDMTPKDAAHASEEDRRKSLIAILRLQVEDEMLRSEQAHENMLLDAAKVFALPGESAT